MTAVSDSSPLILLAKLNCLDLLHRLYPVVTITEEVYQEVVVAGAGLPGSGEIVGAAWIEVRAVADREDLMTLRETVRLGLGELSTILLAKELAAERVLLDDLFARDFAKKRGLRVQGVVGLLETFYANGYLSDLRSMFQKLLVQDAYIDRRLLNMRLKGLRLPAL